MVNLLRFLIKFEILFYFILGIVIILYLRKIFQQRKEYRIALFGLEKETHLRAYSQSLTVLIISAIAGFMLFIITTFVAPGVPGIQQLPTPTVDLTAQPTGEATDTPEVQSTQPGLIGTLEAIYGRGCIPDQIAWTDPQSGSTLSGEVVLKGTVNVPDLGYYKYEYSPASSESWTSIAAGSQTVVNGPLGGTWDTTDKTPGDYLLRLVVYDNANKEFPPRTIQIKIAAP